MVCALSAGALDARVGVLFFRTRGLRLLAVEVEMLLTDQGGRCRNTAVEAQEAPAACTGEPASPPSDACALGGETVLVAATPRATLEAIERSFAELGVRVGYLAPPSLALFEGLAPTLAAAAGGRLRPAPPPRVPRPSSSAAGQ